MSQHRVDFCFSFLSAEILRNFTLRYRMHFRADCFWYSMKIETAFGKFVNLFLVVLKKLAAGQWIKLLFVTSFIFVTLNFCARIQLSFPYQFFWIVFCWSWVSIFLLGLIQEVRYNCWLPASHRLRLPATKNWWDAPAFLRLLAVCSKGWMFSSQSHNQAGIAAGTSKKRYLFKWYHVEKTTFVLNETNVLCFGSHKDWHEMSIINAFNSAMKSNSAVRIFFGFDVDSLGGWTSVIVACKALTYALNAGTGWPDWFPIFSYQSLKRQIPLRGTSSSWLMVKRRSFHSPFAWNKRFMI